MRRLHRGVAEVGGGRGAFGEQLTLCARAVLGTPHGPEITPHDDERETRKQHEERIKAIRERLQEDGVGIHVDRQRPQLAADVADFHADPGRHHRDAGDGCRGSVDDERQLLAADAQLVRDRAHRRADDQRVGVVVEEDEQAENPGRELTAPRCGREARHRFGDPLRTARAADHAHHASEQEREQDQRGVAAVLQLSQCIRVDDAQSGAQKVEVVDEQRADEDTEDKRHHDLSQGDREPDGEQGRQQRDPSRHEAERRAHRGFGAGDHFEAARAAVGGHKPRDAEARLGRLATHGTVVQRGAALDVADDDAHLEILGVRVDRERCPQRLERDALRFDLDFGTNGVGAEQREQREGHQRGAQRRAAGGTQS